MKKIAFLYNGKIEKGFLESNHIIMPSGIHNISIPHSNIQLLPPVINPGKIICVGLNYPPIDTLSWQAPQYPILFHKPKSTLTGHETEIILPEISKKVHYEGELAVIIGAKGKNVPLQKAMDIVDGYTIANDIGAADIEARSSQWASGKMFDTFCPLGPALITKDEIPDPGNLSIRTSLNNQIVQESNTSEMIFNVPFLISYISHLTTLEPEDVILTGSPKRAGELADPRTPLKPGDRISIEIEGLGKLDNQVAAEVH